MENNILIDQIKTTPNIIVNLVEKELDIENIAVRKRTRELTQARLLYFKLARDICKYASLERIGKAVNRDHSTVTHALSTYEIETSNDPYIQSAYNKICDNIKNKTIVPTKQKIIETKIMQLERRLNELTLKINNIEKN